MAKTLPKLIRLDKPAQPDAFGLADSVIGYMLCAWQGEMLVRLQLLPAHAEKDVKSVLAEAKIPATAKRNDKRAETLSRSMLFPANQWHGKFPAELAMGFYGTDFQWAVMKHMLSTPAGHVTSYAELARLAKAPRAARAVGTICAKNPLPFIVPCHRVLAAQGGLGGYGYGTALKRQLLHWENQ